MNQPGASLAIVFLGSSEFAVPSLEALVAAGERVELVVTQPDRPGGRGRQPVPPPVKRAALALGLPIFQPERVNTEESLSRLRELRPELLVVVAYGQILRRALLDLPARGAVNLHASLLPRHRGASPIAAAILAGDAVVGNSTMLIDEGLDSGPVLLQESAPLAPETTRGELEEALSRSGAALLLRTLRELRAGSCSPRPQSSAEATMCGLITREVREIDWNRPAAEVRRLVHALSPVPGAITGFEGRLLKVFRAREEEGTGAPGEILSLEKEGPRVACGEGALVLLEVQVEGKRALSGAEWARGGAVKAGLVLRALSHG
ncbi:MAG: methionyl-tRNA formyltransferase [Deltaproteobacteria bacterium]|nr:methionyl-tRNA formyltransferase [Deltaproteobacteria bacterium]